MEKEEGNNYPTPSPPRSKGQRRIWMKWRRRWERRWRRRRWRFKEEIHACIRIFSCKIFEKNNRIKICISCTLYYSPDLTLLPSWVVWLPGPLVHWRPVGGSTGHFNIFYRYVVYVYVFKYNKMNSHLHYWLVVVLELGYRCLSEIINCTHNSIVDKLLYSS